MPVQWFTLRTVAPFPSVEFGGTNFDEVLEFAQEFAGPDRMTARDGVLVANLPDGDQVVKPGWLVSVRNGDLTVTAGRIRDREWDRADPPG